MTHLHHHSSQPHPLQKLIILPTLLHPPRQNLRPLPPEFLLPLHLPILKRRPRRTFPPLNTRRFLKRLQKPLEPFIRFELLRSWARFPGKEQFLLVHPDEIAEFLHDVLAFDNVVCV